MIISLIGMSGTGKSHWTKKLSQEYDFQRFSCDDLIEQKIAQNVSSNNKVLKNWMCLPGTENFAETQKTYMSLENQMMREILDEVALNPDEDIIIDTTGSVIYCESDILKKIKSLTKVVYLGNCQKNIELNVTRFMQNPCPLIIWAGLYQPLPNENYEQSLERCYRDLFKSRLEHYNNLSDFQISYDIHRSPEFDAKQFLELVGPTINS